MNPAIQKLCIWCAVFLGTLLVIGAAASDPHGFFSASVAAWVQGLGTLAAIWTTVAIYRRQASEAHDREERERQHLAEITQRTRRYELQACRMPVISMVGAMGSMLVLVGPPEKGKPALPPKAAAVIVLAQSRVEYDRATMRELGDVDALFAAANIRKQFGIFELAYDAFMAAPDPQMIAAQMKVMENCVIASRHLLATFEARVKELLAEVG